MSNKGRTSYPEEVEYQLKRKLDYNKDTGVFTWKFIDAKTQGDKYYNGKFAGTVAGTIKKVKNRQGYIDIHLCGHLFKAHRLAWWFEYGYWSEHEIDHINNDRGDNRIENLREGNRNLQNRNSSKRKDNSSGVVGVYWEEKRSKWLSYINYNKKRINLGSFLNKEDAIKARLLAEKKYKFSETHGKSFNKYHNVEEIDV